MIFMNFERRVFQRENGNAVLGILSSFQIKFTLELNVNSLLRIIISFEIILMNTSL